MTRYCGKLEVVTAATGGGYVAMGREDGQGNVSVPIGGLVRVATTIPLIQIGGVQSETGPSWTMGFGRFLTTLIAYFTLWPFLVGLAGALIGGFVPLIIGSNTLSTIGFGLGIAYGVGISLLSAARLVIAYRQMRAG
jgi:hypothetical protein